MAGDVLEASPYRIDVKPGSTTVPRGSDQVIIATIQGFESDKAELLIRKSVKAQFEHIPMVFNNDTKTFEGMLFDLPGSIDYFVESGGVRSDVFTMHAADLPYVKQLEMEYVFPSYTGLAPRKIENGGDIAVLQGTQVRVRITPTMKSPSGRILIDGGTVIPLSAGRRRVHRDDSRHQGRLLSRRAAGRSREQARQRVAAVHDRRARRPGADRVDCEARPGYDGVADRRVRDRSARRRRLRRAAARAGVLGERRSRADEEAHRRGRQVLARNFGRTHVLSRRAEGRTGRLRFVFRARDRQHRTQRIERPLFHPHPQARRAVPLRHVDGRRWRRRRGRRRQHAGRCALAAAARDHFGHAQHRSRPQDDDAGKAAREPRRRRAVAVEAARTGRGPGQPHEQPAGRAGPGVPAHRRAPAEGGRGDARRRRRSCRHRRQPTHFSPRTARSRSCRGPRKNTRSRSASSAEAVVAAAVAPDRFRKISPSSSSRISTSSRTSTKPRKARSSSSRISRSTR